MTNLPRRSFLRLGAGVLAAAVAAGRDERGASRVAAA